MVGQIRVAVRNSPRLAPFYECSIEKVDATFQKGGTIKVRSLEFNMLSSNHHVGKGSKRRFQLSTPYIEVQQSWVIALWETYRMGDGILESSDSEKVLGFIGNKQLHISSLCNAVA